MDLHERQQFDFLLQVAVERYVERAENVGAGRARVDTFVDALFSDFLLNNADGSCFILRALSEGSVEQTLITMAKGAFTDLIRRKIDESPLPPTLEETAQRVDRAVEKVRSLDEPARANGLELKSAIEEFHKDGLTRIVRHLRADPRGKELLLEVTADPAVYALFAMHGIVKTEPPPPAQTGGFVPLANLTMAHGWKPGPEVSELTEARPFRFDINETTSILLLKLNGQVNAFRNECAHQGLPLDGGMVDAEACTITCPWHGFRFDGTTGECLTNPRSKLERIEMKIESGKIQLRPA